MARRSVNKFFAAAAAGLAGGLAGLFFCLGLVAASGEFHQRFHHGGKGGAGPCVVCLLVKGQVESPASTPLIPTVAASFAYALPLPEVVALPDLAYLISPSRAPPGAAVLLPVVA